MTTTTDTNTAIASQPTTRDAMAAKLYDTPPEVKPDPSPVPAVRKLREAERVERMFHEPLSSYGANGAAIDELILTQNPEASQGTIAKQRVEMAHTFTDLGLNREDVSMFTTLLRQPAPADRRESAKALREAHGKDFDGVLALTKRFVARDPSVAKLLGSTALGNHPRVVLRMAELALQARSRGRFK